MSSSNAAGANRAETGGIALIGYRAAGKSSVGARLAGLLDRPFVDLDQAIEERASRSIARIFETDGEDAFRELEQEVLVEQVSSQPNCVLATGGGIVLRASNRRVLRGFGLVVWLDADAETLVARLKVDPRGRPSLTALGLIEEVAAVLSERRPLYQECADLVLDTGVLGPDEAAGLIARAVSHGSPWQPQAERA